MSEHGLTVAIAGATGVVGTAVREILDERGFPVADLRLLASERSVGRLLGFRGDKLKVDVLTAEAFAGVDLAFFACGGDASRAFCPAAAAAGTVVIDKSSAFRQDPAVPLVVPEVNAGALEQHRGIVATPNCSTIQMVVPLKPIYDAAGIDRVVVSTYQAVSGSGKKGPDELRAQTPAALADEPVQPSAYPHQIAFNLLPHIDSFLPNGATKEEQKMVDETQKIFADPQLRVAPTCVRAPVFNAHSEAVNVQTTRPLSAAAARRLLDAAPGVEVVDDPPALRYPMPIDASGHDPVYVGRLRDDDTVQNGLAFWCVADNLRKGAALNAVQIAEELVSRGLIGDRRSSAASA